MGAYLTTFMFKMAALARLSSRLLFRRSQVVVNAARTSSGGAKPTGDKYEAVDSEPSSAAQHFTQPKTLGDMSRVERMTEAGYTLGDQRYEEIERLRGVADPFDMSLQLVKERGSVEKPILVPSITGYRLVGCICEEDECDIEWMTIFKGEMRRCNCGHWFQLVDVNGLTPNFS